MKGGGARKAKTRIVSFRVDEDDFIRLDTLAQQTSYSRAEVLRRCLVGAPLKSTVDAQALTEVARVHADLNRIGGLLKLAIREGVGDCPAPTCIGKQQGLRSDAPLAWRVR